MCMHRSAPHRWLSGGWTCLRAHPNRWNGTTRRVQPLSTSTARLEFAPIPWCRSPHRGVRSAEEDTGYNHVEPCRPNRCSCESSICERRTRKESLRKAYLNPEESLCKEVSCREVLYKEDVSEEGPCEATAKKAFSVEANAVETIRRHETVQKDSEENCVYNTCSSSNTVDKSSRWTHHQNPSTSNCQAPHLHSHFEPDHGDRIPREPLNDEDLCKKHCEDTQHHTSGHQQS
jgi:hypothetical protein